LKKIGFQFLFKTTYRVTGITSHYH